MEQKKKTYYYLPTDCYGQPNGLVNEIQLTEEEYAQRRKREWIFEDKYEAEWRAQC